MMFKIQRFSPEWRSWFYDIISRLSYIFLAVLACLHILTITTVWPLIINSMHTRLETMRQHDLNETSFTPMVIVEHNIPKE